MDVEADELEADVVRRLLHADQRVVRNGLEADVQHVPFAPKGIRPAGHFAARIGELDLVVEEPVLRDRRERQPLLRLQHLLAVRLEDQRLHDGVVPDRQPARLVLDDDVPEKRKRNECDGNWK